MKRQIEKELAAWKNADHRKPLVIRGARQVGKTYTATQFGKNGFKSFIAIDFDQSHSARAIFDGDLSADSILMKVEVFSGKRIIPGETLLFFDEIQACPSAIKALRYLYEQQQGLHVLAAGSLLELAVEEISFPVGRVDFLWMRPMSFSEFLVAQGMETLDERLPVIGGIQTGKIPDVLHEKALEQLRIYVLVGGMPEAVFRYCETRSLTEVNTVLESLSQSLSESLSRYRPSADTFLLRTLFQMLSRTVGSTVKYSSLAPGVRIDKIKKHLQILEQALLFQRVNITSAQGLPLGSDISPAGFKPLFLDIGLMQHLCGIPARDVMMEKDLMNIYRGKLCEQFVGQELLFYGGSEGGKMFYWARASKSSSAEVDYLLVHDSIIRPVEVKSGPSGKLKSLQLFLAEHPASGSGLVLNSSQEMFTTANMEQMPVYSVMKRSL